MTKLTVEDFQKLFVRIFIGATIQTSFAQTIEIKNVFYPLAGTSTQERNVAVRNSTDSAISVNDVTIPLVANTESKSSEKSVATFDVSPVDQNFRKVLTRWSKTSGWTFEPEHWAVARDIPVSGSDAVITDFKTAVRRLLKSTTLTDLPVQPCFYSNNVLRVIPASELCARSEN